MINIRTTPSRRPPSKIAGIEPSKEEMDRYSRKSDEENRRDLNELKEAINLDARDEVIVVSRGPGVEVSVSHDLGFVPRRWRAVDKDGAGDIWRSKTGWTAQSVYFITSADAGVEFTVNLGRLPKRSV